MNNQRILISGASIAGPALAHWLVRYGFRPTIVERAPALREGGYKIDIRGVAVDVVRRMGLFDEVQAAGTDMQGGSYVDAAGRPLVTLDGDTFGFRNPGDLEILRGELARLIYERTAATTEYLFDDSIVALADDGDGVRVHFERRAPRTFDLVIGADGLHSNVRTLAFGAETAFARPLGSYISIFSVPNVWALDRWELTHQRPQKIVNLYSVRGDSQAKALFLFAGDSTPFDRRDVAAQKAMLARKFADVGWEVPRLLAAMETAPDFYFDALMQIEMERWSRGRVALVGDAAYCPSPASGQGTSLALVGAHVLAAELAAAGGDHVVAFARYEQQMRGYVETNQQLGKDFSRQMMQAGRWALWLQTQMLRLFRHLPWKRLMLKPILDKIARAANAMTLPEMSSREEPSYNHPVAYANVR